jgi:L-alanine-DL-glutamate epimerase-like enolase superfamily enzyme
MEHKMRELTATTERWYMKQPFTITNYTFTHAEILYVTISENGVTGRGEAAGVYYLDENGESMLADVESVRRAVENGAGREALLDLLPAGGARNALDCALWDLEAKLQGTSIWELTGLTPAETITVNTVGLGTPEEMAQNARSLDTNRIKVKLSDEKPLERIAAVRAARPDAEIVVDINQGWTFEQLVEWAPKFRDLGIAMIEQPLPRGGDQALEGYEPPVPLCADESCLNTSEFEQASRRYQLINIKLDKTGGLTEALKLADMAKASGIGLMVGNMMGTSLAMAPGYVVAQLCRFVDLDGALFLDADRDHPMHYEHGVLSPPSSELWG